MHITYYIDRDLLASAGGVDTPLISSIQSRWPELIMFLFQIPSINIRLPVQASRSQLTFSARLLVNVKTIRFNLLHLREQNRVNSL